MSVSLEVAYGPDLAGLGVVSYLPAPASVSVVVVRLTRHEARQTTSRVAADRGESFAAERPRNSARSRTGDAVQTPLPRDPLQVRQAAIVEADARAGDEV